MKIRDLLNNRWSFNTRLIIARRIIRCSPVIKRDIARWKRTGIIPDRILPLMINGMEQMTISTDQLVKIYGMDPLSAMLFLDDLIKANKDPDKTALINLVQRLQNGRKSKCLRMSKGMLDKIRVTQPLLWAEYQRLKQRVDADTKNHTEEFADTMDAELSE